MHVTNDLTLNSETENAISVSWESNLEYIINSQGKVIARPTGDSMPVIMTAILQGGSFIVKENYEIKVAPLNNSVWQEMTIDALKELNRNSEMPKITYNDDGIVRSIEDSGTWEFPKSDISPFPVFNMEDARNLIDSYLHVFGLDEDIDIRIKGYSSGVAGNFFNFEQYHNGLRVGGNGVGMGITTNKEGHVVSIGNLYLSNLDIETTPEISLEEAEQIVISEFNVPIQGEEEAELFIYYDRNNPDVAPELAWKIYTYGGILYVYLSAITGEVIYSAPSAIRGGGSNGLITPTNNKNCLRYRLGHR